MQYQLKAHRRSKLRAYSPRNRILEEFRSTSMVSVFNKPEDASHSFQARLGVDSEAGLLEKQQPRHREEFILSNCQANSRTTHVASDGEWQVDDNFSVRKLCSKVVIKPHKDRPARSFATSFKNTMPNYQDRDELARHCSNDRNHVTRHGTLGAVFQGQRGSQYMDETCAMHQRGRGVVKRLSRPSLKSFSCVSSVGVLPSITNCMSNSSKSLVLDMNKKESCSAKPKIIRLRSMKSPSPNDASTSKTRRPSSMQQAFEADVSRSKTNRGSTASNNAGSAESHSCLSIKPGERALRNSAGSETTLPTSSRERSFRGLSSSGGQPGPTSEERKNGAASSGMEVSQLGYSGHIASASISSGVHSTSTLLPASLSGTFPRPRHRRNLEPILSSLASFSSSPDVRLPSPDMPYYRPLRSFPLQGLEQSHWYSSFEGLSEQLFMLEANFFFSGVVSHDRHREMRLDVDSMSYEELLALEESIGNVSTALGKDAISSCLKRRSYSSADTDNAFAVEDEVKCSICQEEFEDGVELGMLKCSHWYHFPCIEQWLLQKNQCPICKGSAA